MALEAFLEEFTGYCPLLPSSNILLLPMPCSILTCPRDVLSLSAQSVGLGSPPSLNLGGSPSVQRLEVGKTAEMVCVTEDGSTAISWKREGDKAFSSFRTRFLRDNTLLR